jgi:hypothetical protein
MPVLEAGQQAGSSMVHSKAMPVLKAGEQAGSCKQVSKQVTSRSQAGQFTSKLMHKQVKLVHKQAVASWSSKQ